MPTDIRETFRPAGFRPMNGDLPKSYWFAEGLADLRAPSWLRLVVLIAVVAVALPAAVAPRQPNRKSAGTVAAWGGLSQGLFADYEGELGNGSTTGSNVPVAVSNLTGVVAVAGGAFHGLALTSDGKVWAWGWNLYGQLGNGSTTGSNVPVAVSNLTGVVAIAGGSFNSLALTSDGKVWAWGGNGSGQLGNGSTAGSNVPVPVSNLSGVVAIAAGNNPYCLALRGDGKVWAWGYNADGGLGNGSTTDSSVPVPVSDVIGFSGQVVAIAAGSNHSLALTSDGKVWAWGDNSAGELGNGSTTGSSVPVPVSDVVGFSGQVVAIAAGELHSLALTSNGKVWAWGDGPLGNNSTTDSSSVPVPVSDVVGFSGQVVAIAVGESHDLALTSNGKVWAWGYNGNGQLGNGSTTDSNVPVQAAIAGVVAIAAGYYYSLALQGQATADAWGSDAYGELGNGDPGNNDTDTPGPVGNLRGVVAISSNGSYSLALTSLGQAWAWGYNYDGELGNGDPSRTNTNSPGRVSDVIDNNGRSVFSGRVAAIAAGGLHGMALTSDGLVWAWGTNELGQLGNGGPRNRSENTPVEVADVVENNVSVFRGRVAAIAGGGYHSLAMTSDGRAWAWGFNQDGQLGNGSTTDSSVPVPVSDVVDVNGVSLFRGRVVAMAAGNAHSLALTSDGQVWAWGANLCGELGTGDSVERNVPVQVRDVVDVKGVSLFRGRVVAIAAVSCHSLALTSDGQVWLWGESFGGIDYQPVQVSGVPSGRAVAIAGGYAHSLALTSDGVVWAWGWNQDGQLGNGSTTGSNVPVAVSNLTGAVAIAAGHAHSLATALPITEVAISSSPTSLGFTVSGTECQTTSYTAPATLVLAQGASCQIGFASPQSGPRGTMYVFRHWTDGDASNPRTIPPSVVNGTSATYTAMFDVLYQLTTASSPPAGGVVLPSSGAFYSAGSVFALQAFANPGYQFANFSGALSGSTNPQNITLNGPANVVANFTKQAPSLAASVGARSGEAAWRQVTLTLTNTGVVAATNVRITDITGIQVLTGNGLVSKISTFPMDVSPSIGKASSAVANAIFGWPETAQRVRFTVNFTADGGYAGSTTITTFR